MGVTIRGVHGGADYALPLELAARAPHRSAFKLLLRLGAANLNWIDIKLGYMGHLADCLGELAHDNRGELLKDFLRAISANVPHPRVLYEVLWESLMHQPNEIPEDSADKQRNTVG